MINTNWEKEATIIYSHIFYMSKIYSVYLFAYGRILIKLIFQVGLSDATRELLQTECRLRIHDLCSCVLQQINQMLIKEYLCFLSSYLVRSISWLKILVAGSRDWQQPDCHRHQFWTQNSHWDTCYPTHQTPGGCSTITRNISSRSSSSSDSDKGAAMEQKETAVREINQWCYSNWP